LIFVAEWQIADQATFWPEVKRLFVRSPSSSEHLSHLGDRRTKLPHVVIEQLRAQGTARKAPYRVNTSDRQRGNSMQGHGITRLTTYVRALAIPVGVISSFGGATSSW
jgi:hypothetical protein